jgi:GT2 family glycosyltransferase
MRMNAVRDAPLSDEVVTEQSQCCPPRNPYSEVIHLLSQRYHEEWLRAESLKDELDNMRGSRLWQAVSWLRTIKQRFWPIPVAPEPRMIARAVPYASPQGVARPRGRISIVIPFRDRLELLRACLHSLSATNYRDFDIILVDNGSTEPKTLRYLKRYQSLGRFQVVDSPGEFNFSRLCNEGAARADGEYLLFLNNDTEVIDPDWLDQLMGPAMDSGVGVVGATLLYPNRTIQHVGIVPRDDGLWTHPYRGHSIDFPGDDGELLVPRIVPAVTAACLLIRRSLFFAIEGFDERFPVSHNDIDLCRRVREKGLLVVVSPFSRLLHYEGLSRGFSIDLPKPRDAELPQSPPNGLR